MWNSNIHQASLTNWISDGGEGNTHFYTLSKYWTVPDSDKGLPWELEDGVEFFVEVRSYTGPSPYVCTEHKYTLTPSQYSLTLFELLTNGPAAAHTYIAKESPTWLATALTSAT